MDDDGFPCGVGLGRRLRALRKVREGIGTCELGARLRSASPVAAVAGDAAALVETLAIFCVGRIGILQFLRAAECSVRGKYDAKADQK